MFLKFINNFKNELRLELVGDAVLDVLITQYIFGDKREHSPGELTNLRQSLVNNKFFGHLSVKHNFPQYMCYQSQDVFKKLSEYCELHKRCSPDIAYLNIEYQTNENNIGEEKNKSDFENHNENDIDIDNDKDEDIDVDPPKFLADLFEAVAGAIYLDSNCSLNAVWKSYYSMLEPYLGNIPINNLVCHFKNITMKFSIKKHSSLIHHNPQLRH